MSKLRHLYAFVVEDHHGREGVLRRDTPAGTQPMIADDRERLEQFRPEAEDAAGRMRLPLKVVRFDRSSPGEDLT